VSDLVSVNELNVLHQFVIDDRSGGEIFCTHLRLVFYAMGAWSFRGVKWPGHGVNHSHPVALR
jgi:hypothetical protein